MDGEDERGVLAHAQVRDADQALIFPQCMEAHAERRNALDAIEVPDLRLQRGVHWLACIQVYRERPLGLGVWVRVVTLVRWTG